MQVVVSSVAWVSRMGHLISVITGGQVRASWQVVMAFRAAACLGFCFRLPCRDRCFQTRKRHRQRLFLAHPGVGLRAAVLC